MARSVFATLFLVTVLSGPSALGASSRITMIRDGKTVKLSHGIASRFHSSDGKTEAHLLFAEKAPDGVTMVDPFGEVSFAVQKWSSAAKVAAIHISFKEDDPENFSLQVYTGDDSVMTLGGHASGDGLQGAFSKLTLTPSSVAGEISVDAGGSQIKGPFNLTAATVEEAPASHGATVAKSEQAVVLLGFARAMSRLNFKEAQKYSMRNVEEEFAAAREAIGEKAVKKFIQESFGNPKDLEKRLNSKDSELAIAGDSARIRLIERTKDESGEHSSTETFSFHKVEGVWKME